MLLICLVLLVVTLAVYMPVFRNAFINYDDDVYVYRNSFVKAGLTAKGLAWAFNVGYAGNWHPLTWMSHMADYQFFRDNPAGHHATNLIFHMASTVLLFLVLRRMTSRPGSMQAGSSWKSAFVAALFALHPLHVESVAWVAERKDVLSTFFWMLTMGAYVLYSEKPSIKRYVPVILLFALGLMSKPMLVSLPIILLLLDYWPLGRMEKSGKLKLILEKMPLLAMSAGSAIITFTAQNKEGAVGSFQNYPIGVRVANAIVAYAGYVGKTVFPHNLAIFYPHPGNTLAVWQIAGSAVILAAITSLVFYYGRKRRYLAVGWLWFVITLIPVIGLVQVGRQAMADRYTYFPLIGLFLIVASLLPDLARETKRRGDGAMGRWGETPGNALVIVACAIVIMLAAATRVQVGYWRDSRMLFQHAVDVTRNNYLAHINLGMAHEDEKEYGEAMRQYRESLKIKSENDLAHFCLGGALMDQGRFDEAADEFRTAIALYPNYSLAHYNLGLVFDLQGKPNEAKAEYLKAMTLNAQMAPPHNNLGIILVNEGKIDEAIAQFREALEIEPDHAMAHLNLGLALAGQGKVNEAIPEYRKSIACNPDLPNAYYSLGKALEGQAKLSEAAEQYRRALEIDPSCREAMAGLKRLDDN